MPGERLRVHFESLTRSAVFHITVAEVAAAKRRHPEVAARIIASRGENLVGLSRILPKIEVLISSEFVLSHPDFPLCTLELAAPRLRWIHVTNAGVEKLLPLDWLPRSVTLTNSSGAHFAKALEFATMAILMLHARLPQIIDNQHKRKWEKVLTPSVAGKTLCVLGVGHVGRAFALAGRRLGLKVVGVRSLAKPSPYVDRMYSSADLHRALRQADFVAVCLPLTADTEHLIGAREFRSMRPGVGFINVGRARVVDYQAMQSGLTAGHVSGAIVDVFDPEPLPPDAELWAAPNLILAPHVVLDDAERFLGNCLDIGFANLARYLDKGRLRNRVSRSTGY